jgi:hypothetical protein
MNKSEMKNYVDEICEREGYENSPAYDLIYSECCAGRNDNDAKELIDEMLAKYNG